MTYVRVTSKRQITLPKEILEKIGANTGDLLELDFEGNVIKLKPSQKTIFDLKGTLKVAEPQDFKSIREKVLEEVAKEIIIEGKST